MTRQPRTGTPLTGHRADEALPPADARPVVDPALVLDEQLERAPCAGRQRQGTVMVVAGQHADGLPVEEHLGPVADRTDRQHRRQRGRAGHVDARHVNVSLVQGEPLNLAEFVGADGIVA